MDSTMSLRHDNAEVNGIRLHYVTAGQGEPLVLIHGFPQTWFEWRHVIPTLAEKYFVIAPDYRGAGTSERPAGGYDKRTMAKDIRELVKQLVGDTPINLLGHDIGAQVAFAYASDYEDTVKRFIHMDAPLPGSQLWDDAMNTDRLWHVRFHNQRDFAEMLVSGHERQYIQEFISQRAFRPDLALEGSDEYVARYSESGGLRAGFEAYRAIPDVDTVVNRAQIKSGRKLKMPVLLLGGSITTSGQRLGEMAAEVYENFRHVVIDKCGHWIPEEQPERFLDEVAGFLSE